MRFFTVFILVCLGLTEIWSQTFEIYTGVNIGTGVKSNEFYHKEPINRQLPPRIFPVVGYRLNSKISQRIGLIYGLEFNKIGASKYYLEDKTVLDRYNFDSFIELSQIKFNSGVSINIFRRIYAEAAYSLGYTFDKNVNFIFIEDEKEFIWKSAYKPFSHIGSLGLNLQFDKFSLRGSYNFGLSPIYDTGKDFPFDIDQYPDWKRERLILNYFNIVIGYQL